MYMSKSMWTLWHTRMYSKHLLVWVEPRKQCHREWVGKSEHITYAVVTDSESSDCNENCQKFPHLQQIEQTYCLMHRYLGIRKWIYQA